MNIKAIIGICLSVLILGKAIIMDTKMLVSLFETNVITFVAGCFEYDEELAEDTTGHAEVTDSEDIYDLTIESLCDFPINYKEFAWVPKFIPRVNKRYAQYYSGFTISIGKIPNPPPEF